MSTQYFMIERLYFMIEKLKRYSHIWILSYAFIYLPWFSYLEKTVTRDYYVIHTALDDLIPFSEYFIVPYLLWFVYVAGTILFFFFKNKQTYYRLCIYLFTGMTLSLVICTIFPNGTDLRTVVDPGKNVFCWMISVLHRADTNTNIFPSIHVFNSLVVHITICKSDELGRLRLVKIASLVLCVSICLSTMVLKQHSVVDVMGAALMAYGLYPLAYGTLPSPQRRKVKAWGNS